MIKESNVIAKREIEKYVLTAYKRENPTSFTNHPYALLYVKLTPKAKYSLSKTISHYVYKTEDELLAALNKYYGNLTANIEADTKRKADRKAANAAVVASDFYKVGDIILNTWGWEQTNVDFYQVVEVKNKTIVVKEITYTMVENSMYSHAMACNVMPDVDSFKEDGDQYALRVYAEGRLSNPESYYYMHKWDGKSQYKSWYA